MKKMVSWAMAALATVLASAPTHVAAQGKQVPSLVIYGDQKCPTDNDGNEVVVCVRRPASEQFRIPKELRDFKVTPENESWAAKVAANDHVADSGIGSCSNVGPGGASGCFLQNSQINRATNKERARDQRVLESTIGK
ncbi:hypothetical protein PX554_02715 [Sphingomonas sp. H39-1-10]|uniref:hypothetical protein n=1 Tax=Sphingomonas pollutisoli TaxID=3030829 RepID=UPI0023BA3AFE|nr:hypothetical protein [Sphingomonas pollutisoli]MDF0487030.1 hypothetical protein [Sphingomonas pollutisoli]